MVWNAVIIFFLRTLALKTITWLLLRLWLLLWLPVRLQWLTQSHVRRLLRMVWLWLWLWLGLRLSKWRCSANPVRLGCSSCAVRSVDTGAGQAKVHVPCSYDHPAGGCC